MKIKQTWLVKTEYGMNLMVLTETGTYYQQVHQSLSYDGGGAATWVKITEQQAKALIVSEPIKDEHPNNSQGH